jgi:hypothetical protein
LLQLHVRAGLAAAARAGALCAALSLTGVILQESPTAALQAVASSLFSATPALGARLLVLSTTLLMAWAANKRIAPIATGSLRHFPFTDVECKRAVLLTLVVAELPLCACLAALAVVGRARGAAIGWPALRWSGIAVAGAVASAPIRWRSNAIAGSVAVALALSPQATMLALVVAIPLALTLRRRRHHAKRTGAFRSHSSMPLPWRIALRVVGSRLLFVETAALVVVAAGWLFVSNNGLPERHASIVARLAGGIACAVCVFAVSTMLDVRRPAWPFARSLPQSTARQIFEEGAFLLACLIPVVLATAAIDVPAAVQLLPAAPLFACRALAHVLAVGDRRAHALMFMTEALALSAVLAFLPELGLLFAALTYPAFVVAAKSARGRKVTVWQDR